MRKILLTLAALALFICPARGYTLSSVRSLSAAAAISNGTSFGFTSGTGGLQFSVLLSGSGTFSYQVQVKMTDGTWVPAGAVVSVTGTLSSQVTSFSGPFYDMRVVLTAWTSGTLTADIFCTH
jgi:hypothetical protein